MLAGLPGYIWFMIAKHKLFFACLLLLPSVALSQKDPDAALRVQTLVNQLGSTDRAVRMSAESELKKSPTPEALPILLNATESSSGDVRAALVRILSFYNDPRKIPVLIKIRKAFLDDEELHVGDQLQLLGDPAAQALMDSLPDPCDDSATDVGMYVSWVGFVIGGMNRTNPEPMSPLISGLRSVNPCKQRAASEALQTCCAAPGTGLGDPEIILFTEALSSKDERIRLAASHWIDAFKGDYKKLEFGGIREVLIAAYQNNAPPATMVEIARLLAEDRCPRVTRFMRAAVHAPNADIVHIAQEYLSQNRSSAPN